MEVGNRNNLTSVSVTSALVGRRARQPQRKKSLLVEALATVASVDLETVFGLTLAYLLSSFLALSCRPFCQHTR